MEVLNVTNSGTKVDLQFFQKENATFEKRPIQAITVGRRGDDLSWLQQETASPSPNSKLEIRRGFKGPSPLKNLYNDSPTTDATSRSTMTMRGRSISPSKALLGESPTPKASESVQSRTKSTRNVASDLDLPSVSDYVPSKGPSRRSIVNPKLRQMSYPGTSRARNPDDGNFQANPEPVPFQPQNFLSSTMMKKIPIPKRHMDTFGGMEYSLGSRRGVILHTDRYQWENARSLDGLTQRERLRAELDYMEKLRGIKRRREILPHRAKLDLLMGGTKVEFAERFDIQREIQKLKSLIMPAHAKDLYHGRGISLPSNHSSIMPKKAPVLDYDSDEDLTGSGIATLQRFAKHPPDSERLRNKRNNYDGQLPRISSRSTVLGIGSTSPLILSKEKRQVDLIKARIRVPTEPRAEKKPITIRVQDMMGRGERFSEDGYWTPVTSRQGSSPAYLKRSRTNITSKFDSFYQRSYTAYSEVPEKLGLKITPNAENVKRVDIPSASVEKAQEPPKYRRPDQQPQTRGSNRTVTVPTPFHETAPSETATDNKGDIPDDEPLEMDIEGAGDESRSVKSRASKVNSPVKAVTPNPLKGSELSNMLPENQKDELKATFKKLDTDSDGHIMYNQLQSQLPKGLNSQQERFLKEVYDITSSSTFFGVDEFLTMSTLTSTVTGLGEQAVESFSKIDFATIHDQILHFVEMFQSVDRAGRGKISLESLQEVLSSLLGKDLKTDLDTWNKLLDVLNPSEEIQVTKIEFLAHIPYFLSLKS